MFFGGVAFGSITKLSVIPIFGQSATFMAKKGVLGVVLRSLGVFGQHVNGLLTISRGTSLTISTSYTTYGG